jgi:hypothetical protein
MHRASRGQTSVLVWVGMRLVNEQVGSQRYCNDTCAATMAGRILPPLILQAIASSTVPTISSSPSLFLPSASYFWFRPSLPFPSHTNTSCTVRQSRVKLKHLHPHISPGLHPSTCSEEQDSRLARGSSRLPQEPLKSARRILALPLVGVLEGCRPRSVTYPTHMPRPSGSFTAFSASTHHNSIFSHLHAARCSWYPYNHSDRSIWGQSEQHHSPCNLRNAPGNCAYLLIYIMYSE